MAPVRDAVIRAWTSLLSGVPGEREWRALRLEARHPLDVFAAVREQDRIRGILFECHISSSPGTRVRFESEGLRLFDDWDAGKGTRRIALALERPDLESVFLVITEDLIASSRLASDVEQAILAVGARLSAWQTCLKLRKEGFGPERILGLYGELVILEQLGESIGLDHAIARWSGPEHGLHDFQAGRVSIEVKTCVGARGIVRIGSLDQLDPSSLESLALCRVVVVPDDAGTDLSELVAMTREAADNMGTSVRHDLDHRLLMSGYLDPEDRGAAHFDRLSVATVETYDVRGGFPRLTRETVEAAVVSVEYGLDVTTASSYQMSPEAVRLMLSRFGHGSANGQ
jgi:hypothetical protein